MMRWFNPKDAEEYRDRIEEMAEERQMQDGLYGSSARYRNEDEPSYLPRHYAGLAAAEGWNLP